MIYTKKGISPVVATSLLIVVAVVAILGFSNWNNQYQSTLQSDVEVKGKGAGGAVKVEYIGNDGTLYVSNSYDTNQTMDSIKVGSVDCNLNEELGPGVTQIDISSCLNQTGTNDIVIVTDSGVYEQSVFVDETPTVISFSFSGNLLWTVENIYDFIFAYNLKLDSSNNVYTTGTTRVGGYDRNFLNKYDSSGNLLWNITYWSGSDEDDYSYCLDFKDSNTISMFGEIYNGGTNLDRIAKYDFSTLDGSFIEVNNFTDSANETYPSDYCDYLSNGDIFLSGWSGAVSDQLMYRLDTNFNILWNKSLNISYEGYQIDSSENIFTHSGTQISKYDSSGNLIWNNVAPADPERLGIDNLGNPIYVSRSGGTRAMKYDTNGNLLWDKTYNIPIDSEQIRDVETDANNNIFIGVRSAPTTDTIALVLDSDGNSLVNVTNVTYGGFDINPTKIEVDSENNLLIYGTYHNGSQNIGLLLKYD